MRVRGRTRACERQQQHLGDAQLTPGPAADVAAASHADADVEAASPVPVQMWQRRTSITRSTFGWLSRRMINISRCNGRHRRAATSGAKPHVARVQRSNMRRTAPMRQRSRRNAQHSSRATRMREWIVSAHGATMAKTCAVCYSLDWMLASAVASTAGRHLPTYLHLGELALARRLGVLRNARLRQHFHRVLELTLHCTPRHALYHGDTVAVVDQHNP